MPWSASCGTSSAATRCYAAAIGSEAFCGSCRLVTRKALYFDGPLGEQVRIEDVPPSMEEEVRRGRQELLEALAMYSDELMELLLAEEEVPEAMIREVVRSAVHGEQFTPVFLGTAYRNKGVQPLLDAVVHYLPSPLDCENQALVHGQTETKIRLEPSPDEPAVAMAFKVVEDPYGALTFMRIYQGRLAKGETYFNQRSGRKERFSRIVRMHADEREDIDEALAGDIVAVLGVDCASGDTYATQYPYCTLQSMLVPEPVIRSRLPADRGGAERLAKALHRFRREDRRCGSRRTRKPARH